jgi:spore coat polysaccharide biosynthesis protein SpsF (cytidylyltransferase family)
MSYSVLGILQARTTSSRLPGKVLEPILGKPMLSLQLERLFRCNNIDHIVVATSDDGSDDGLENLCVKEGVDCYRGSLDDVLDRFINAAKKYRPQVIVRFTADCPLTDPVLIDEIIEYFLSSNIDYLSNCEPPTYPDGLDVEVFKFNSLEIASREAKLPSEREHVTPFIRNRPGRFRVKNYVNKIDRSDFRWTVDEPEDLAFVREVYKQLYVENPRFTTIDILNLLEQYPELNMINNQFNRNEGSKKSIDADEQFLSKQSLND